MTAESKSLVERLRAPAYWMSGSSEGHEGDNTAPIEAADTIVRLEREKEEAAGRGGHLTGCIEKLTRERDVARERAEAAESELTRLKSPMEGAKPKAPLEVRAAVRRWCSDFDFEHPATGELIIRCLDDLDHATAQARSAADDAQHQEPGGTTYCTPDGPEWCRQTEDRCWECPKRLATPPAPSALDRAVEALSAAHSHLTVRNQAQDEYVIGLVETALSAIRGNGGGT